MNTSSDNHEQSSIDDLHDRLVDRALAEVVGNETPPDLTARILSADYQPSPLKGESAVVPSSRRRLRWMFAAIAATLLIATSVVLLMTQSPSRQLAKTSTITEAANGRNKDIHSTNNSLRLSSASPGDQQPQSPRSSDPISSYAVPGEVQTRIVPRSDFDSLTTDLIASTTTPQSEAEVAEEGRAFEPNLSLVISQTQEVDGANEAAPAAPAQAPAATYPYPAFTTDVAEVEDRFAVAPSSGEGRILREYAISPSDGLRDTETPRAGFDLGSRWKKREELTANGTGPGLSGDQYTRIIENPFIKAEGGAAVSTFSIDVDTASYANVRQFLLEMNQLPPLDAVRIEELVNYFDYNYAGPNSDDESPFAAHVEVAGCPWTPDHRLVRIGIKGRELDRNKRPKSNLVFLVDVSGSMDEPNKLPLVVYGLQQLTRELGENDRVAIVVYASSEGLVLPSTPGSKQDVILDALGKLSAGGSTAGGAGIQLAYQIAEDNFIEGGTNRVILCTDGDFNVGVTSTAELERLCEEKAKGTRVFLSVLGFGRGNLNDTMMQAISNRGNGNHYYVDGRSEARRVLVEEMTGTLITIAKDVKIQVEFNPRKVAGYRLIGYENRMLRTEDFNDDKKDAGEIGAGHTVTALYEVVPAGKPVEVAPVDDLKYQQPATEIGDDAEIGGELLTLKMRYKTPEGDTSKKLEWPVTDDGKAFSAASEDCQFASAVAGFGMLLRNSQHKGNLTYAAALELAQSALGEDEHGYRSEFLDMLRKAKSLKGE
jgi:secreted protein with Ig-like and vWFA domain